MNHFNRGSLPTSTFYRGIIPVWVSGKNKGGAAWKKELDLGSFWRLLELLESKSPADNSFNGEDTGTKKVNRKAGAQFFEDVRKLRREAKEVANDIEKWHEWIQCYCPGMARWSIIPKWCIELGKKLR